MRRQRAPETRRRGSGREPVAVALPVRAAHRGDRWHVRRDGQPSGAWQPEPRRWCAVTAEPPCHRQTSTPTPAPSTSSQRPSRRHRPRSGRRRLDAAEWLGFEVVHDARRRLSGPATRDVAGDPSLRDRPRPAAPPGEPADGLSQGRHRRSRRPRADRHGPSHVADRLALGDPGAALPGLRRQRSTSDPTTLTLDGWYAPPGGSAGLDRRSRAAPTSRRAAPRAGSSTGSARREAPAPSAAG